MHLSISPAAAGSLAPTAVAPTAAMPQIGVATPPSPPTTIDAALAQMMRGPVGIALSKATRDQGVRIIVTEEAGFANYSNHTVRVNPKVLAGGYSVPGVLAHELGHAYVDLAGLLKPLHKLPYNLGTVGNEIVAEAMASVIARDSGFARGASSVTTPEGTLRSIRGALDNILTSDFYVKYYKIDLTKCTEQVRADTARTLYQLSADAITKLGGTVPPEYAGV